MSPQPQILVHEAGPALVAVRGTDRLGLATFRFHGDECELLSLDALEKHGGIGSALLAGVAREAADGGLHDELELELHLGAAS